MPPGTDAPAPGGGQTLTLAGRADMRNPLGMIKKPPQLSQAKRDAPARALKGLEDAAAAAQDCLWQRVRTCMLTHVQLAPHRDVRGCQHALASNQGQANPGPREYMS